MKIAKDDWQYDFSYFPGALSIVFINWLLAPGSFLLAMKIFQVEFTANQGFTVFALYGYAYIWMIFGSIAALIPFWIGRLVV